MRLSKLQKPTSSRPSKRSTLELDTYGCNVIRKSDNTPIHKYISAASSDDSALALHPRLYCKPRTEQLLGDRFGRNDTPADSAMPKSRFGAAPNNTHVPRTR